MLSLQRAFEFFPSLVWLALLPSFSLPSPPLLAVEFQFCDSVNHPMQCFSSDSFIDFHLLTFRLSLSPNHDTWYLYIIRAMDWIGACTYGNKLAHSLSLSLLHTHTHTHTLSLSLSLSLSVDCAVLFISCVPLSTSALL
jgi:hypothetical protein